jgi:hypothetical protein
MQGTENPLPMRELQVCATRSNPWPHTRNEQESGLSPLVGSLFSCKSRKKLKDPARFTAGLAAVGQQ